jgi:hypothetical protein
MHHRPSPVERRPRAQPTSTVPASAGGAALVPLVVGSSWRAGGLFCRSSSWRPASLNVLAVLIVSKAVLMFRGRSCIASPNIRRLPACLLRGACLLPAERRLGEHRLLATAMTAARTSAPRLMVLPTQSPSPRLSRTLRLLGRRPASFALGGRRPRALPMVSLVGSRGGGRGTTPGRASVLVCPTARLGRLGLGRWLGRRFKGGWRLRVRRLSAVRRGGIPQQGLPRVQHCAEICQARIGKGPARRGRE